MNDLIKHIKDKTQNKLSDIKIPEVVYSKIDNTVYVKVVYRKEREVFCDKERAELAQLIHEHLGLNVKVNVKTKKALIDDDVVREYVIQHLQNHYKSVLTNFNKNDIKVEINNEKVRIAIPFILSFYNFLKSKSYENVLREHLSDNFFEEFDILLNILETNTEEAFLNDHINRANEQYFVAEDKPKYLILESVTEFMGDVINDAALAPESVRGVQQNIAVAGTVKYITKRSFTSKQKTEQGNFIQKEYFSFNLSYGAAMLACVAFMPQSDIEEFEKTIIDGEQVVVFGDAEKFNEKINFKVKRLSQCVIVPQKEEEVPCKQENAEYIYVKPEPYIMLEQSNLFDILEDNVNDFLRKNDVVVFDFETTGLDAMRNEIIEIGAVRVSNGKITETFSALIKPKQGISQEITDITGITDEMVRNCYSIDNVLPDFYKFTRNSVLSAYNIAFDNGFLHAASKRLGYNFDNRQIDTMFLARTKLFGVKNFKLKTVAAALDIPLENAHRAVHDAIATAEVFIKLSDDLQ